MRVLIIGGTTNGIGKTVADLIKLENLGGGSRVEVFTPSPIEDLDVREPLSVNRWIAHNGPFDQIVYSAGVSSLRWIKDLDWSDLFTTFGVNTFGLVYIAGAHLREFPGHPVRCVAVVSDAAHKPMRGSLAYTASKAAMEMVVRQMGRELAPDWITVGVSPGVVEDTEMTNKVDEEVPALRGWTSEQARSYADAGMVLPHRVTKEEVAETILFALDGPAHLNGNIITINGGN